MRFDLPVDADAARAAIADALTTFPSMQPFAASATLRCLPIPGGGSTFVVRYEPALPQGITDAWEFQNAVVRAYKQRTGGTPGGACHS